MLDIIRCRIFFSSTLMSKIIKVKIQKNIILPFVLYGCETWSPTVSKEHRPSVFGNRMLRNIFWPVLDMVMGEWGWWHNNIFYDLYSPICIMKLRRMRCVKHVAHMGKRRGAYRILVGRPRHRWWDDIKMDLQEVGWGALTILIWLMIGTGWRLFWMQ